MRYLFGILSVGALLTVTFGGIEAMTDDSSQIVQGKETNVAEDNFNKTLDKIGFLMATPPMLGEGEDVVSRITNALDGAVTFLNDDKCFALNFEVADYDELVARLEAHPEIWDDIVSVMRPLKRAKKKTASIPTKKSCLRSFALTAANIALHQRN